MTDFSWTQQHELIPVRSVVQAALAAHGLHFTAPPKGLSAQQRPRAIGETSDGRLRVELIGPADVVFKATMMVTLEEGHPLDSAYADLAQFLPIVVPAWAEGAAWLKASLAALEQHPTVTTRYRELEIALRTARQGSQLVLGITWQGPT